MIHSLVHRAHNPSLGIFLLRVALGVVFIYHGYQKIADMEPIIGFFGMLGFAPFLAYAVAYTELIGGILLIAGLFTRLASIALAIVMAVAVYHVHLANGFSVGSGGYEYALTLMLGSLAVFFTGAGRYSLARAMKMCENCEGSH